MNFVLRYQEVEIVVQIDVQKYLVDCHDIL